MRELKTDEQLLDAIAQFGYGETDFHTEDIERVIVDKRNLEKGVKDLINMIKSEISTESTPKMGKHRPLRENEYLKLLNRAEKILEPKKFDRD